MKVFINRMIPEAGIQLLNEAGIDVLVWKEKRALTREETIEKCSGCDGLISAGNTRIDADLLNACSHLKVIALHSVGFDNIDLATATRLKIPVGNTPGVVSNATADVAFLLMLAASRKAFYMHRRIIEGKWKFFDPVANLGIELRGKTIGIFGLGKIGFEMAKLCVNAYDMKVIYHNRHRNVKAEQELSATYVTMGELLANSDVISVHTNLTSETRGIFDRTMFGKMKSTAIFINTARGGIHNEADLIFALQQGVIWGAGLDVTNPEPMEPNNPLLFMPNVAVTPHIGTATIETRSAQSILAAKNVIAAFRGERIPYLVNPKVYE